MHPIGQNIPVIYPHFENAIVQASLRLPKRQHKDAPARCPALEGQERYIYQHARVELWLRWHCHYLVCVERGSRRPDRCWVCDMDTKYLLRYLHPCFAAERACVVVSYESLLGA